MAAAVHRDQRELSRCRISFWPALAALGSVPEACSEVWTGLAIDPSVQHPSISRQYAERQSDNAIAGRERIIDGLRKAGVSEA